MSLLLFRPLKQSPPAMQQKLVPAQSSRRGGRWKVFKGANDGWLEEFRLYHRGGDGRVVDENDDAISASRWHARRAPRVGGTFQLGNPGGSPDRARKALNADTIRE